MTNKLVVGSKIVKLDLRSPDWVPSGNKILVQLDKVESFTHSGIFVPPQVTERNQMNQTEGTVAILGPLAYKDMRAWDAATQGWTQIDWIKPGDRVKFQLHHGWVHLETTEDGVKYEYRVLHDTDITMVLRGKETNHD